MHQLEFEIERVRDLPDSAYWQMLESTAEIRRREVAAARAYNEGLQRLREEYVERLHALFLNKPDGKRKLDKYLAVSKEHRAKLRAAKRELTPMPQSHQEFDKTRQRLLEKSKIFTQQAGVEKAEINSLRQDLEKQREGLFGSTVGKGEAVTAIPRKRPKNATFTPPYDGRAHYLSSSIFIGDPTDNFPAPTAFMSTNRSVGTLVVASNMRVWDASDLDTAEVICRTGMTKWFRMPSAGQLRVSFTAEVIDDFYLGRIRNEWGNSFVVVRQDLSLYAQVLSPLPKNEEPVKVFRHMSGGLYEDFREDDHSWDSRRWIPGTAQAMPQVVFASTMPGQPIFPKNAMVLVEVGVSHRNYFYSDDCEVRSNHGSHFWIKGIGLSSTGSS